MDEVNSKQEAFGCEDSECIRSDFAVDCLVDLVQNELRERVVLLDEG